MVMFVAELLSGDVSLFYLFKVLICVLFWGFELFRVKSSVWLIRYCVKFKFLGIEFVIFKFEFCLESSCFNSV